VLNRSPVPERTINPDIPLRLEEIISKSLHKNRDQRYQHAADIRADLQQLERGPDSGWKAADQITQTVQLSSDIGLHPTGEHRAQNPATQTGTHRSPRVSKIIDSLAVLLENSSRDPSTNTATESPAV
jgi:serine/threonine-protein kinase